MPKKPKRITLDALQKIAGLERALQKSRQQLRAVTATLEATQSQSSVGAWECDVATGEVSWSDRLKEMLAIPVTGATAAEQIHARIHPDSIAQWKALFEAAVASQTALNMEVRLRRRGRDYIWLHMLGQITGGDDGTPRRIAGTARDISYRKNAEGARMHIKERFELALQSLSVGIWDWDLVESGLYWSPKFLDMLGIRDPAFRPKQLDFEKRLHAEDAQRVIAALTDHVQNGTPFDAECRLRHENGRYLSTRLCGVAERNARGKALRMVGSVEDISLRKESERKLSEREARLRNMFEHAVDGLITINVFGIVQSYNPACETIFGYAAREVVGQDINMLMPRSHRDPGGIVTNDAATQHARIIDIGGEVEGRRKDGSLFPMDLSISQFDAGGETLFSGIVRDITGRKEVERLKNEFISIVSHELRTPLTSIRGALGLLTSSSGNASPERVQELLNIAQRNSQSLMVLINDILDIEKLESGTMKLSLQPVNVATLLADAVTAISAYAGRFRVTLRLSLKPMLPPVMADPDRLMQVLANLLSNAAKFTREGTEVLVSAERRGSAIRISVRDHGQGIAEDLKPKLFGKFVQADPSNERERAGTGLGLSIARQFARLMHGDVDCTSRPGEGATFFVDLPIAASAASAIVEQPAPRAAKRARKKSATGGA